MPWIELNRLYDISKYMWIFVSWWKDIVIYTPEQEQIKLGQEFLEVSEHSSMIGPTGCYVHFFNRQEQYWQNN